MKIKLNIEFEDCKVIGDVSGDFSGEVCFDEFGIITESKLKSVKLGSCKNAKKTAKRFLRNTAERVRSDLVRKMKKNKCL